MTYSPRHNTQEARVEGFLRAAQRAGLTVYGFELLEGRGIRVLTQPSRPIEAPHDTAVEDDVDRWLRENP